MFLEEEAKTKWCPMVRFKIGPDDDVYANRAMEVKLDSINCIASDCMMWRWATFEYEKTGYCGLAGFQA